MKIAIDNGHGLHTSGKRTPPFPNTGKVIHEWEFNHPTALKLAEILKADGHEVLLVSNTTADTPLLTRASLANKWGANLLISIHYNALKGVWGTHGGTETLYYPSSTNSKRAATLVQNELIRSLQWRDRGIKPRADLAILNRTVMPAILVEVGFMDNLTEASKMLDNNFQFKTAVAIANGINQYFNYTPRRGTPIEGKPSATVLQMQNWARNKGATPSFINLASLFYMIGVKNSINPAIAYAQAAKETGYGSFKGVIDASFHNTCGLKVTKGGGNNDPRAHQKFLNWRQGVEAHIDHLALYAGIPGYPYFLSPDPRHFPYLFGTALTVEELGGKWAPSTTYGTEILQLVKEMENTPVGKPLIVDVFGKLFRWR